LAAGQTPVVLVANKVDAAAHEAAALEATELGYGLPVMVSATSAYRKSELFEVIRDRIDWAAFCAASDRNEGGHSGVAVAIIGKRNTGKSTLVNALAGSERVIVSEHEGTTRDAIDVHFEIDGRAFTAIDTAGVRKRKSLANDVEFYSYHRCLRSIRRADAVVLLIDATVPVSHVDKQLGIQILRHHKPCIIAVNKWDLAQEQHTQQQYVAYLDNALAGLDFAPLAFISAMRSEGLRPLVAMAMNLYEQASHRVTTSLLNHHLAQIVAASTPRSKSGRQAKIFYATQTEVRPPTVCLWVNHPEMFDSGYQRFLINRFRQVLPFSEVPIKLQIHGRRRIPKSDLAEEPS
jgi:GTP-binding protein